MPVLVEDAAEAVAPADVKAGGSVRTALLSGFWLLSSVPPQASNAIRIPPTSSSWLNLVERWFAELTNRKLRRSAHRSVTELETDIRKWINEWNKDPRPFVWTKTADQILETLAAYCERINDSGH